MLENSIIPAEKIIELLGEEPVVSDEEYENWKSWYATLPEYEKVGHFLGVVSQYLTSGCKASAAILAIAIIYTNRWVSEQEMDDF